MKKQIKKPVVNAVEVVEIDPVEALQAATIEFITTVPDIIGVKATTDFLSALKDQIISDPDIAIKLSKPETLQQLKSLGEAMKGKKPNQLMFELPNLIKQVKQIMA